MKNEKARSSKKSSNKSFKDGLETPVMYCPSVGPKRAQSLEKLNISTVRDLLWHLPRSYEDYHTITQITHLNAGQVATVVGDVVSIEERSPASRFSKVRHILNVQVKDATAYMKVVWFNQQFLVKNMHVGSRVLLHGKVELYDYLPQMSSPKVQVLDDNKDTESMPDLVPLYPLCDGLTQNIIHKIIQKAFERFGKECVEFLPESILKKYEYPSREESFRILHDPKPDDGAPTSGAGQEPELFKQDEQGEVLQAGSPETPWEKARRRLVFEEFLLHQFILRRINGSRKKGQGIAHPAPTPDPWLDQETGVNPDDKLCWPALFVRNLPFELTDDQIKVCREIAQDMVLSDPMSRLLQGDVGSGKTVVSLFAMLIAASGGSQAALMVPTEILAQQHAATIRKLTQSIPGLRVAVLRGSAKAKERRENMEALASGEAQIAVGTHALFQEKVQFKNLGLVVVDEQHKFGVNQRQKMIEKGSHPDLLVATATPIPRTLSLTMFGDMDVSLIRSLPPGRPELISRWTTWGKEKKVWEFVDERIEEGQQVYVVCPIIEPSEEMPQLPSTEEAFERLSETFFPHRRVAILHGRHSAEDKEDLMARMQAGEIDVVVATTVIEVGVDLPNATVMAVLGAERFGLAQLHQLRGRVGRGTEKSYCILITHPNIATYAEERMRVLEKTRDGFKIADEDLRLRGPGEQFGTRQSGHINFRIADPVQDGELLRQANQAASEIYQQDPDLKMPEHKLLKKELILAFNRMESFRPS
jgi:ATP-dependent DNA helicase RecG